MDVNVWQKAFDTGLADEDQLKHDIVAKINEFLHPLLGGIDGTGWEVGADQTIAPLFECIKPPDEVGFISSLGIAIPQNIPPNPYEERPYPINPLPSAWVKFADYEMVCSAGADAHTVTVNHIGQQS